MVFEGLLPHRLPFVLPVWPVLCALLHSHLRGCCVSKKVSLTCLLYSRLPRYLLHCSYPFTLSPENYHSILLSVPWNCLAQEEPCQPLDGHQESRWESTDTFSRSFSFTTSSLSDGPLFSPVSHSESFSSCQLPFHLFNKYLLSVSYGARHPTPPPPCAILELLVLIWGGRQGRRGATVGK